MTLCPACTVSEACQINDLDHGDLLDWFDAKVSEACQINDLDHAGLRLHEQGLVSEACQINDLDHSRLCLFQGSESYFRKIWD